MRISCRSLRGLLALLLLAAVFAVGPPARAALVIEMRAAPDPVRPGGLVRVEIVVGNTGPATLADVQLSSTMPAGLYRVESFALAGFAASGCIPYCNAGGVARWALGTLPAGATRRVAFFPIVLPAPANGDRIEFAAEVASGALVASASAGVEVQREGAFSLAASSSASPVAPGGTFLYTFDFGLPVADAPVDATLRVDLPAGLTLLGASGAAALVDADTVSWSLGEIAPGKSGQERLLVRTSAGIASGSLRELEAVISETAAAPAPTRIARARVVVPVESASPLRLAVEASPDPARANEVLNVSFTAANAGASALGGAVLEFATPTSLYRIENFTDLEQQSGCIPYCNASAIGGWILGTVPASQDRTAAMFPTVLPGTRSGDLVVFEATLRDSQGRITTGVDVVHVGQPAFDVLLREDRDPAIPGKNLVYEIDYGSRAGGVAREAELRVDIPIGTTLLDAGAGAVLVDADTVAWDLGLLAPGQGGKRRMVLRVLGSQSTGSLVRGHAEIVERGPAATPAEAAWTESVARVDSASPLRLSVEASPDPVRSGETLSVAFTATNEGATAIEGVVVEFTTPQGLYRVESFGGGVATGGCVPYCNAARIGRYRIGTLAPGEGRTVTMYPIVLPGTPGGTLIEFEGEVRDDAGRSAAASASVHVGAPALELLLHESADPVIPGAGMAYTLELGHPGATPASDVRLRMDVPSGTTFVSASDGGVMIDADTVEWSLGTIDSGAGLRRELRVATAEALPAGSTIRATASAFEDTGAPSPIVIAWAEAATRVERANPLRLAVEVAPDPATRNGLLYVTYVATNAGEAPVEDAVLEIGIPDGLYRVESFASGVATGGCIPYCNASWIGTFTVGDLAPGEGRVVAAFPFVVATLSGQLLEFEASLTDGAGRNATAASAARLGSPRFSLALASGDDPVAPGGAASFALDFARVAAGAAEDAVVRFELPPGTLLESASGDPDRVTADAIEWDVVALAPGESERRVVRVRLDPAVTEGAILPAHARIVPASPNSSPVGAVRARSLARVANEPLALVVRAAPDPVGRSGKMTISYTVRNRSSADLEDVVIDAVTPTGLFRVETFSDGPLTSGCIPYCNASARGTWSLGSLAAGASRTVTMSPTTQSSPGALPFGSILPFAAHARAAGGLAARGSDVTRIGVGTDADADGAGDVRDNCTRVANPDQRDTNGDGYGNACDADLNDDGIVNFLDLSLMKARFLGTDPDADLTGEGLVNFSDLARMKQLFLKPPGPSEVGQ